MDLSDLDLKLCGSVSRIRRCRPEGSPRLAADYLVMAAWLAYLKSRKLLPRDDSKEGEPSAEERPARLRNGCDIAGDPPCRRVANGRPQLGRDVSALAQPQECRGSSATVCGTPASTTSCPPMPARGKSMRWLASRSRSVRLVSFRRARERWSGFWGRSRIGHRWMLPPSICADPVAHALHGAQPSRRRWKWCARKVELRPGQGLRLYSCGQGPVQRQPPSLRDDGDWTA